ncbi:uncharacterized protein BO80DRAFT_414231 [Aspergillus ibericus CBS 121593]|uniref:Mid2 domain-containing protein n=1 Tax=Aspergillus ibericus CBS 121593 TaxID=1448316 RepID=A0A395GRI1_9EURO|nr:hypothetical protein BO80DRAFT_414231 [Aspergillus ibericus CBS 121593]RAK97578.1 hypothetical protein BO80DRAFT_414231 [Aspergillus ibericus CBS 121593]
MTSDVSSTITSLSSIFTPPASCSTAWTYEGSYYNQISNGLLLQNAVYIDSSCFPAGFGNAGRVAYGSIYSPDWCPEGYTSPQVNIAGTATTAVCCISDFSYYTTPTTVGDLISTNVVFAGCLSMYPASAGETTVPCRNDTAKTCTTVVSGPITMWAQPITVAFNAEQASEYSAITASTTTSSTTSQLSAGASVTMVQASATTTATTATATAASASGNNGLSTGAKAGIGVGVAVGALLIINFFALFWLKRRRRPVMDYNNGYMYPPPPKGARQTRLVELYSGHRPAEMADPDGRYLSRSELQG